MKRLLFAMLFPFILATPVVIVVYIPTVIRYVCSRLNVDPANVGLVGIVLIGYVTFACIGYASCNE